MQSHSLDEAAINVTASYTVVAGEIVLEAEDMAALQYGPALLLFYERLWQHCEHSCHTT